MSAAVSALIVIHVIDGVAQIVGQYFLNLELITPCLDRFRAFIDQFRTLLIRKDLRRIDLAFDQFQLRGLDKEVEERLTNMSIEQGQPAVNAIIQRVKNDTENYVTQYAQLSAIELDRVLAEDPAYKMVGDRLIEEITYLDELDV